MHKNMTPEEYQQILETEQPFIEYKGELKQMPFYISPKLKEWWLSERKG